MITFAFFIGNCFEFTKLYHPTSNYLHATIYCCRKFLFAMRENNAFTGTLRAGTLLETANYRFSF